MVKRKEKSPSGASPEHKLPRTEDSAKSPVQTCGICIGSPSDCDPPDTNLHGDGDPAGSRHLFHRQCLVRWAWVLRKTQQKRASCPGCRLPLPDRVMNELNRLLPGPPPDHSIVVKAVRTFVEEKAVDLDALLQLLPTVCTPQTVNGVDPSGCTALHYAAAANLWQVVELLLKHGANPNGMYHPQGLTPLHQAVRSGAKESVLALLRHPDCEVHPWNRLGQSPLRDAAAREQWDICKILIEHSPHPQRGIGGDALVEAASARSFETCELLLQWGGCDVSQRGRNGHTALHHAAASGNMELGRLLLNQPTIEVTGKRETPLHVAAGNGHAEFCALLLDHGADPTLVATFDDDQEWDPLQLALARKQHAVCRVFFERCPQLLRPSLLHVAARSGDLDMCQHLLQEHHLWDKQILFSAVRSGNPEVVRLFLEAGKWPDRSAILSARSEPDKRTLLHWAAMDGSYEMCQFLLDEGADVNALDVWNLTPYSRAKLYRQDAICRLFAKRGANPNFGTLV
jgi:ankyrin repeat protein